MPPIWGRIVTVEYGMTWPTGGGSICTVRLVSTAGATSTGTPAPGPGLALREQPWLSMAATSARAEIKAEFFMPDSVGEFDVDALAGGGLERGGELFQELRIRFLKTRLKNRLARDEFRQLWKDRGKH